MSAKKIIIRSILGILLIGTCIIAYMVYNISQQHKKLQMGEMTIGQEIDTIPFTYSTSGHIVIQVKVPGVDEKQPFMLDCGASNMLFEGHCAEIDTKNNGFGIGIGAGGNFFTSKIKQLEFLQIGSHKFSGINAKQTNFNIDCSDEICGLIGTGVMHNLDWQIDFETKQIFISTNIENFNISEEAIVVPLRVNKNSKHIKTSFQFGSDKKKHWVLVDIGNSGTLHFNENHILKDSVNFQFKKVLGEKGHALGKENKQESDEKIFLADTMLFDNGNFMIENFPIDASPGALNLLGLGLFKKYKTTISWKDEQLLLEPYDTEQDFIWTTFGFWQKFDDELGKVIISNICEGTSAHFANVPVGAEIISINEFQFSDKESMCAYKSSKISTDELELVINQGGKPEKFILTRAPIFE